MSIDLRRSYTSSTLLDIFLKDTPEILQQHVDDLHKKNEWEDFIAKCTGEGEGKSDSNPIQSNEKEFKDLIRCIANLEGLSMYFGRVQKKPDSSLHCRS